MVTKVDFWELRRCLMLDPLYGDETNATPPMFNAATPAMINGIYRDNQRDVRYTRFDGAFSWTPPIKEDRYRELICLWCLMGLPNYQHNQRLDWRPEEFAERWSEDFDIQLDELKAFLRRHKWPLPIAFFPSEPDNSEAKLNIEQAEFSEGWDKLQELAKLESQIADWGSKTAKTVTEELRKEARLKRLRRQHEHLEAWFNEHNREEGTTNVTLSECRELLQDIGEWQEYVSRTPSDRDRKDQRIRELKSALVQVISEELRFSYEKAVAELPRTEYKPGLEDCLTEDQFLQGAKRHKPQEPKRREQQIQVLLHVIADLGFQPMAVESKAEVKEVCLEKYFGLFTPSGFDHAWKKASNRGLLQIKDKQKYAPR